MSGVCMLGICCLRLGIAARSAAVYCDHKLTFAQHCMYPTLQMLAHIQQPVPCVSYQLTPIAYFHKLNGSYAGRLVSESITSNSLERVKFRKQAGMLCRHCVRSYGREGDIIFKLDHVSSDCILKSDFGIGSCGTTATAEVQELCG